MNYQRSGSAPARRRRVWQTTVCACAGFLLATSAFAERVDGYSSWQWNGFCRSSAACEPLANSDSSLVAAFSSLSAEAAAVPVSSSGTAILSGVVYYDANHDSVRDASDWGIPGARVELTVAGSDMKVSAVTSSNGSYTFTNLPPGDYSVTLLTPSSQPDTASVGVLLKGDEVVPASAAVAGIDSIVNIALADGYVGTDFDFPQAAYPTYLISKRLLLNTDPGIDHTTPRTVPEPSTLRLIAMVGLGLAGLVWQRRRRPE